MRELVTGRDTEADGLDVAGREVEVDPVVIVVDTLRRSIRWA